jgi:hypothetical protein
MFVKPVLIAAIAALFLAVAPAHAETLINRWPKHDRFVCRGILASGSVTDDGPASAGVYHLKPDKGMLPWCEMADIADGADSNSLKHPSPPIVDHVLNTCKVGDHCEIKGIIEGHGVFDWATISSVRKLRR